MVADGQVNHVGKAVGLCVHLVPTLPRGNAYVWLGGRAMGSHAGAWEPEMNIHF